eukprot:scaffold443_cov527-Prasinococcus_capsulatus_cf.AAC.19
MAQVKLMHDQMEQERDYYFNKLRDVEILCQHEAAKDKPLARAVLKILYSVDADTKNVLQEVRSWTCTPPSSPIASESSAEEIVAQAGQPKQAPASKGSPALGAPSRSPLATSNKENSLPDVFSGEALAAAAEQVAASLNTCDSAEDVMSLKLPQKVELFDVSKENNENCNTPESPLVPVA